MKYIWVLVDKETQTFWNNGKGSRRAVQAYSSEAKAWAALANFWPKPDPTTVEVKKFREVTL